MSDSTIQPDGLPAPADSLQSGAEARRGRLRASVLIGLCCFAIYNANLRSISAGDTYPARYLPFAIVRYQTIFLDPVAKVAAQGRGKGAYWALLRPDGHILSLYPIVTPLLVAPLYVPAVAYLEWSGWTDSRLDHVARVMEKLAASFVAALSASLLYLLLRRRAKASTALLLTLAYALGTTTWVISSQALWQHGPATLLVIAALLILTGRCTVPRTIAAGALLGLIAANRPPDVFLAAALGIYGLYWAGRRRAALLFAASVLPGLLILFYNFRTAGNIFGGYGVIGSAKFFEHPLLPGVAGLLVSPTRGLLVFSPFFLFLAFAWRYWPRNRADRHLWLAMVAAVVIQLALYAKADWRGGLSWGPRYMTDFLPFLIWMLVPVVDALRRAGKAVFIALVAVAVVFEAIGAFSYVGWVDMAVLARERGDSDIHDMRGAWAWRNTPILTAPRYGVAPPELLRRVHGSFDAVEAGGRPVTSIVAGQEAYAAGWTLAGDATPWQLAITIDGRHGGATRAFTDRPDVREALQVDSPSGWRIPLETAGLAPGEYRLTVMAWAYEDGEGRYVTDRPLTVLGPAASAGAASPAVPADLTESYAKAAARIREHQDARGYWLTSHTTEARFHEPRPEMNTFLTALMVDLLDPLPADAGLDGHVQRARQHLTAQIEAGGLVRYHGLPDGPGIGTLGCAITPDTDNTALVWRLAAPSDRGPLTAALATIDRYRTRDGLYRTWLAPRDEYQCLDPGSDPNPADIAIQMHLLMLLSEERPAAGRALCEAIRSRADDDRVWVYYRKAPLVPMLRLPDLRGAGCALELPESRTRTSVPDQQIWVSVVELLASDAVRDRALIRAVLRELARDDFALIRTNPPLLYHNDLTATVPRYYWSEDAGYALWLRLHEEYDHPGAPDLGG